MGNMTHIEDINNVKLTMHDLHGKHKTDAVSNEVLIEFGPLHNL